MKTILVIEDDLDISELLEVILESLGYEVVSLSVPLSLEDLKELKPNLILLDHYISHELGSVYCQQIKANAGTKHIPVLIVSAAPGLDKIAKDVCADGFIAKPFDIAMFESAIKVHAK